MNFRQKAKAKGEPIYFGAPPCIYGHSEEGRYTSNSACVTCARARARAQHDQLRNALLLLKAAQ